MRLKKFYYKKIKSTNNKALMHIKKGREKGIILAEFQTIGKGQRGNKWISFKGNLFMSVFFKIGNQISLNKITKINCMIVQKCLQKFTNYKVVIKKPNDILIKQQKISGILQETINKNNKKSLIVGIGLNLVKNPIIRNYPTTNLNDLINKNISKKKIEQELKKIFENNLFKFVNIKKKR